MNDITIRQALRAWSELSDAFHGCNGYGGDTAEIYAYTLIPDNPTIRLMPSGDLLQQAQKESGSIAWANLQEIIRLFKERYECRVAILDVQYPFIHRCHVRVTAGTS